MKQQKPMQLLVGLWNLSDPLCFTGGPASLTFVGVSHQSSAAPTTHNVTTLAVRPARAGGRADGGFIQTASHPFSLRACNKGAAATAMMAGPYKVDLTGKVCTSHQVERIIRSLIGRSTNAAKAKGRMIHSFLAAGCVRICRQTANRVGTVVD